MGIMTTLGLACYLAIRAGWAGRSAAIGGGIEPEVVR
jgi:hypothetical protein